MSDPFDLPEPYSGTQPPDEEYTPEAAAPDGNEPHRPRPRHDAFTEARKCAFLEALVKTGCILDAARLIGVSARTIYRHQELDPRFLANCRAALRMSATPVELTAWQRAVEGVEQEFACGGQVHVRRRYDSGLLRLLLQGSNPRKYGSRPGFKRKRILKHERKQMRREIKAELQVTAPECSLEEERASILRKVAAMERHKESAKVAAGWTKTPNGEWLPPGYGPLPGFALSQPTGDGLEPARGAEPPGDSMCQS